MKRYWRNYLLFLLPYLVLAEAFIFCSSHHLRLDPFFQINGVILLVGGGFGLFCAGFIGLIEAY